MAFAGHSVLMYIAFFGNKGKFILILAQTTRVLVKQQVRVTAGVTEGKLFL